MKHFSQVFKQYRTELSMLLVFCAFFLIMTFASPFFLTKGNLLNVTSQISTTAILAIGMSLVIITGGIDLSVGASLGFSSMVAGIYLMQTGNIITAIGILIGLSLLVGLINGFLIGYIGLPAFIVTLGTQKICRSLDYVISNGNSATQFPEIFGVIGRGKMLDSVPVYLIINVLLFAIFIFVMGKTKYGRYVYAIGSNGAAARLSGINTKKNIMFAYLFSGLLSGIAGLIMISRLMAVDPTYGTEAEMDAIAAVVIGGTSMMGGKGTLWGTIVGVLLVGCLRNALNLLGVNTFWQGSVLGAVIIVAVMAEKLSSQRKNHG